VRREEEHFVVRRLSDLVRSSHMSEISPAPTLLLAA
jgi:hypothetical protein